MGGGNNFYPASYSPKTKLLYIPSMSSCNEVTLDPSLSNKAGDWKGASFRHIERNESDIIVADPFTGEITKKVHIPYTNNSGVLSTAGGVIFTGYTDGTFAAYDDTTLEQLWKINVGTGFNAPPMTFEVGGKQYVAILSGLSRIAIGRARLHAGTARHAQPDDAVRVRIVSARSPDEAAALAVAQSGAVMRYVERLIPDCAIARRRCG